jgi:hypothetical protein
VGPIGDDLSFGMPASGRCEQCHARLAADQRYCIVCGARRGALPAMAAAMIAAAPPPAAPAAAVTVLPAPAPWFPSARVAAVAVMAVLGFGVIVGSSVRPQPTGERAAIALVPPAAVAPPPLPAAAPAGLRATVPTGTSVADNTPIEGGDESTGGSQSGSRGAAPASTSKLPDVKHVFLIVLSGHGFDETFGDASPAPYLAKTLTARGELLAGYHAVAQGQLANEIALISGQGPTVQTAEDCPTYADVAPATMAADGQVKGDGCVYPARAQTIGDQLTAKGKSWKAYVEDLETGRAADAPDCRHPTLGASDGEGAPRPRDPYTTTRNPFVYFHSIIDGDGCEDGLADLSRLEPDLATSAGAPSLAYIVPNRCHDGSDTTCAAGEPTGLAAADAFLRTVVPAIESSAAYKDGGLIAITFDEAPQTGPNADSSSCCDAPLYPNLPDANAPATARAPMSRAVVEAASTVVPEPPAQPEQPAAVGDATPASAETAAAVEPAVATPVTPPDAAPPDAPPPPASAPPPPAAAPAAPTARGADGEPIGGGRVGLLLISKFVKPGSVERVGTYNHFSLLRSIEDLFALKHLGYAADPSLLAFDKAIYNATGAKAVAADG